MSVYFVFGGAKEARRRLQLNKTRFRRNRGSVERWLALVNRVSGELRVAVLYVAKLQACATFAWPGLSACAMNCRLALLLDLLRESEASSRPFRSVPIASCMAPPKKSHVAGVALRARYTSAPLCPCVSVYMVCWACLRQPLHHQSKFKPKSTYPPP